MKKFWVAMMSIFVLLGGVILSACTKQEVSLSLSSSFVEISIDDPEDKVVTAEVKGVSEGRVSATSSNTGIVIATVVYNSATKLNTVTLRVPTDNDGKIVGNEGTTQVIITSLDDSTKTQTITVNVYSDILGMEQKKEDFEQGKNPFYAIRGEEVTLDYSKLLSFTNNTRPNSRKDISWELVEDGASANIDGNKLFVESAYLGNKIKIRAVSQHDRNITAEVELNVINKIDKESVQISYRPTENSAWENINDLKDKTFRIVPNLPADDNYDGYIQLSFKGNSLLDVVPVITGTTFEGRQIIRVDRTKEPEITNDSIIYTYRVFALNEQVNGDSKLSFNIKYSDYDYSVDTDFVEVQSYEKINALNILDENKIDISNSTQLIYTSYQNGYGKLLNVELLPTTVVSKEGKFTISVNYSDATYDEDENNRIDTQTVKFYYKSRQGNNILVQMKENGFNQFVSVEDSIPLGVNQIYVVAGSDQVKTSIQNVKITFTSVDNPNVSSTLTTNLYRSASSLNFTSEDKNGLDFVASTALGEQREFVKRVKLEGQSSIVGLSTQTFGNGFIVSNPYNAVASANSITFNIKLTVTSAGVTEKGSYRIVHENGIASAEFGVSLFLPLTDATINYDLGTGNTSVNSFENNDIHYVVNGTNGLREVAGKGQSLSKMLLQTNSSIPLEVAKNKVGRFEAEAEVKYTFLDKTKENEDTFHDLSANTIYNEANKVNGSVSAYLGIGRNGTIITNSLAGHTYIVATFTGRELDEDGNLRQISIVRIIEVEVHVAMGILSSSQTSLTVYAGDSVNSTELANLEVSISLGDRLVEPVTYDELEKFNFTSTILKESVKGQQNISWSQGNNYYSLSNIIVNGKTMTFTLVGNTTLGNPEFNDNLIIEYEYANIYRRLVLDIKVLNADRIEKVEWVNQSEQGLYFELNSLVNQSAVLVMSTSPSNAKDQSLSYFVTDLIGNPANFVRINEISRRGIVNMNATAGAAGYIYVMPKDAYNGNTISYFFKEGSEEKQGSVSTAMIGRIKDNSTTWFEYLRDNAYFKNNQNQEIKFGDILVQIPVTVADGKSWDTAYRLYNSASFAEINSFNYYIVMNSVVLKNWKGINEFQGGIKGLNKEVTITLSDGSASFINTLKKTENSNNGGEVRDLTFAGQVYGNGFVANVNYGLIDNVTIDVSVGANVVSSKVISDGEFAGGLVGENHGSINNVGVLGVSVECQNENSHVGGIAGYNTGNISNARVEFYTFKDNKVNTLKGDYVGGLVGFADGGRIELSYAYDYSLVNDKTSKHLDGQAGAFVGFVNNNTSISQSFSVVNIQSTSAGRASNATLDLTDTYVSYYDASQTYQSSINGSGANWVSSGEDFLAYVNGEKAHLRNIYQAKEVTAEEVQGAKISERIVKSDKYYQALEVGNSGEKAILFYYTTNEHDSEDLTSSEINYLADLNRINLSEIFGDIADRLVITSSNINIVDVTNDSLIIKRTGIVNLTISSKQNYVNTKAIEVQVVYALSALQVSWATGGQPTNHVKGDIVNIQKESNISIQYTLSNSEIYLGVSEKSYKMVENVTVYNYKILPNNYLTSNMAGNVLSVQTTNSTAELSNITAWISINSFASEAMKDYREAIANEFAYAFDLQLFEGAINLLLSQNQLPITPSEVGVLEVELISNNASDKLDVELVFNGENNYTEKLSGSLDSATKSGIFSRGSEERIEVRYEQISNILDENSGRTTFKYRFTFAVASSYKNKVSKVEDYTVTLRSFSNVQSKSFSLKINKQEFTNIDIKAYEARLSYSSVDNATLYNLDKNKATSVLKPGDIALLEVKVNPTYAYYDYFDLVVSGSPNANAIGLGYMKPFKNSDNVFVDGEYSSITGGIRVTDKPTTEKELATLVFKVWVDPNLAQDADIELILTFNHAIDGYIDHTSCFLSISYLAEPSLKVDGKEADAMIARGTIVPVEVEVNYDQSIDLSSASLINIQEGITLSPNWKETTNSEIGRKVFSTTLTATVNASIRKDATEFYVFVRISRVINGAVEWKETRVNVKLVDFMIDGENVNIFGQNGNKYLSYLGIERSLKFDYNLFPETYSYDVSNLTSAQKVAELNQKRIKFNQEGFYQEEGNFYSINYNYINGQLVKIPLWERLSYWSDLSNGWVDIYNKESKTFNTAGGNYQFTIHGASYDSNGDIINPESCDLMVTGLRQTVSPTRFKLKTFIQNGGTESSVALKEYFFEMDCDTYSSEYLPIIVRNEEDFDALREGDPQDYILTNDIVLEDYTPFSTGSIRSLDGNGYTIYINSFDTNIENANSLRLALFNEVKEGTTLKNIRVNVYNGGNIDVDISKFTNGAQIAGFAITNQGVITNCEVVSFYQSGKTPSRLSGDTGLNIKFINGKGNTSESLLNDNSTWRQTQIAGFVIDNMGNITNSRVGGDSVVRLTDRRSTDVVNSINQTLEIFNINAQGDMAGFVLNNSGSISSSFAKNIAMNNKSNSTNKYLAGFVGVNTGKILSSYVEGVKEENGADSFCSLGTSLASTLGVISGFVYTNQGNIKDTYSNILITNNRANDYVYLASGFVYNNEADGTIENSYSASQVTSSKYSQMNFTGISIDGEIKNSGKYINNYYYYSTKISGSSGSITEEDFATGATRLERVADQNYFYGFAFASDTYSKDGVWEITNLGGVKLVEPNIIALSNRYEIENPNGTVEGKTYLLPYSSIETQDRGRVDTSYGSKDNPIIIRTAKEFNEVMGNSKDSDIAKNYNSVDRPNQIFGSYRLVDDIDLNELITSSTETTFDLSSVNYSFTGKFYGNGFNISNLSIGARDKRFAFGMFASIENSAIVLNFNLSVNQVINNESASTGAIAGIVRNSKIVNVKITGNESASIEGGNFVGGVAGMVIGDSQIKNIAIENIRVVAVRYDTQLTENESVFTKISSQRWRMEYISRVGSATIAQVASGVISNLFDYVDRYSYSYAGGLVGYADVYKLPNDGATQSYQYSTLRSLKDYDFTTLRASGDIYVMGQVAGGVIGYQGVRTMIMDAGLTINGNSTTNNSHIVATKFYAGGVIGQANSALSQIFAEHANQDVIESNISNYYNSTSSTGIERGALDLFGTGRDNETYTQIAIGGLVGLANGGSLVISYSKLNAVANTTNYAGGIVGRIDTQTNSTFTFNNGQTDEQASYLMHEVYATGDVRARFVRNPSQDNQSGYAGGIVGGISNETRLALMSVNAMNMLSTYNYATDEELLDSDFDGKINISGDEQTTKTFSNINVYTIAGQVENVNNSLIFVKKTRVEGAGEDAKLKPFASIGFVSKYNRTPIVPSKPIIAVAYQGYQLRETQSLEEDKDFYVSGYTSIDSILSGFGTTFGIFIGSRLWSPDNWAHTNAHLYPSIRYTVANENFKWLDAYNDSIYEVLAAMQENKNLQVRVRGYVGPNTQIIQDIDIREFMNTDTRAKSLSIIDSFQGQIIYSSDWVNGAHKPNGEEPRIILDRPLINSAGEGFAISNVTFELSQNKENSVNVYNGPESYYYTPQGGENESYTVYGGAIVNGDIALGSITATQIIVKNTIHLYGTSNLLGNVGLLSSSISSSSIDNLTISNQISDGTALLMVGGDVISNVGLVAGSYAQTSVKPIHVEGLRLDVSNAENRNAANDIITFTTSATTSNLNVGGFFGSISKVDEIDTGEIPGDMTIEIGTTIYTPDGDANSKNISGINLVNITEGALVNVGGFAGFLSGAMNSLKLDTGSEQSSAQFRMGIIVDSNLGAVNAGLLIGESNGVYSISGQSKSSRNLVEGFITTVNGQKAASANIGGVIGFAGGEITLTNTSVEVAIAGGLAYGTYHNNANYLSLVQDLSKSDETDSLNKIGDNLTFAITGAANVGGLIGRANSTLTIDGNDSAYPIKVNANRLPIAISSDTENTQKPVYIGGLVGQVNRSLYAKNYIISNSTIIYKDASSVDMTGSIGGFVGQAEGETSICGEFKTSGENPDSKLTQISRSQILTNANVIVGGIVGELPGNNNSSSIQAKIQGTSFGGAYKILGGNAVNFGGTIGAFEYQTNTAISLKDNFNFGDVFNINDTEFGDNGYNFGGVIGSATGTAAGITAQNNFSLVTNHNQTYFTRDNAETISAMFGNGVQVANNDKDKNYYNHALSMAIDDQASDIAYGEEYDTDIYRGYGENKTNEFSLLDIATGGGKTGNGDNDYPKQIVNITTLLAEELRTTDKDFGGGKLRPFEVKSTSSQDMTTYYNINSVFSKTDDSDVIYFTTNGIKYYRLKGDIQLNTTSTLFEHSKVGDSDSPYHSATRIIKNIALIGDSFTISYEQEIAYADSNDKKLNPLIAEMQGNAFVSGLNVEVNVNSETMNSITNSGAGQYVYGGLVNKVESGKVYSVGVTGNISVGGTQNVFLGGIVGKIEKGSIEESNSSVNIVYRGAGITPVGDDDSKVSLIGGIAGVTEKTWIRYSYSAGNIFTYTSAQTFAISNGSEETNIEDSYTIEHMEITDVTISEDVAIQPDLCGDATIVSFGNTRAASEIETTNSSIEDISSLINVNKNNLGSNTFAWSQTYDQNYNYPIRKNLYSHATSYYTRNTDEILEYDRGRGIARYEYTRVSLKVFNKNLNTSTGNIYYFGIPNVDVLGKINAISTSKSTVTPANQETGEAEVSVLRNNLVILNNLNISKAGGLSLLSSENQFNLDGNGKAIKNLTNALFNSLKANIKLENIRLIDVKLNNANNGVLANSIDNVTVNNITAQGNTISAGVIGTAKNSAIQNVSSLLIINNLTSTDNLANPVGGIVGWAKNSQIQYCNNNATIILKAAGSEDAVGGIVGLAQATSIDNCYNTAGIAVNYTTETTNTYYVGGIVGRTEKYEKTTETEGITEIIESKITNCYNTGLLRAGTKESTGKAYVGGIVGSTQSNIENCINEASIEGRSKSSWTFENVTINGVKDDGLLMKQGQRHLYVYGIGFVDGDGQINNCSIAEEAQIVANGNSLDDYTIINAWSKTIGEDVVKEVTIGDDTKYELKVAGLGYYKQDVKPDGWNDNGPNRELFLTAFIGDIATFWVPKPWSYIALATTAILRKAARDNPFNEEYSVDQKNYVGYYSSGAINNYETDGTLKKVAGSPAGDYKIEITSYDNNGFPRSLKIPYTIYQNINVINKNDGGERNFNKEVNTVYYYFWDNIQHLSQKKYDDTGYTDITLQNSITYQNNYNKDYNTTKLLSNVGTLSSVKPSQVSSWETLKSSITNSETAKYIKNSSGELVKDKTQTSIYVNGTRYYLADGDNEGLYKVLMQDIEEVSVELEFNISNNPTNSNEIMDLGNANKYLVTCERAKELGIENINIESYSKVDNKLILSLNIAVNRKSLNGGDINWSNVPFKVDYKYEAEREIDFSDSIYALYTSTGNIVIKMGQDFELPRNDDEESKIFYTYENGVYIKHSPNIDNLSIWKTRDENKNEIYLVFNSLASTFTYYNDGSLYIDEYENGTTSKKQVNIDQNGDGLDKTPNDFAGHIYTFYVTTINESQTEANLISINNVANTTTSISKVEYNLSQLKEDINIPYTEIGNVENNTDLLSSLTTKTKYQYTRSTGKILIPQKLTEDMYYEESETEVDTRIGHIMSGTDAIVDLKYVKDENNEYIINAVEIKTTELNVLIGDKALTATLSNTNLNYIDLTFTVPDTVNEDSQIINAFENAFVVGDFAKATVEFDAFEKEFASADIQTEINLSTYVSNSPYKAAIVADGYLLAKYENGNWSLQNNTITINGATVSLLVDGADPLLNISAKNLSQVQLNKIKEILGLAKLYKQLINYSGFSYTGEVLDTSIHTMGGGSNGLSYSYNLKYDYTLNNENTNLNYDNGKGVVVSGELKTLGDGNKQLQVTTTMSPTYTWDGFGIMIGEVQAIRLNYTIDKTPITTNLNVELTNTTSDYSLVSYTNFKVNNSVTKFEDVDGNTNIELARGDSLSYHYKDEFTSFELESATFINKYVQLIAKKSVNDDANEIYIDYEYNTTINIDDFTVNLTYDYNKSPTWNGGTIANSLKYEIKDNGEIDWYTERETVLNDGTIALRKSLVLSYSYNQTDNTWEYYKYSALKSMPTSIYFAQNNGTSINSYLYKETVDGKAGAMLDESKVIGMSTIAYKPSIVYIPFVGADNKIQLVEHLVSENDVGNADLVMISAKINENEEVINSSYNEIYKDTDGSYKIVYEPKVDENGEIILDENGDPVFDDSKPVLLPEYEVNKVSGNSYKFYLYNNQVYLIERTISIPGQNDQKIYYSVGQDPYYTGAAEKINLNLETGKYTSSTDDNNYQTSGENQYVVGDNDIVYNVKDLIKIQKLAVQTKFSQNNSLDKVWRWYLDDESLLNFVNKNTYELGNGGSHVNIKTSSWEDEAQKKLPDFNIKENLPFEINLNKDIINIYDSYNLNTLLNEKYEQHYDIKDGNSHIAEFKYKLDDYEKILLSINIQQDASIIIKSINQAVDYDREIFEGIILNKDYNLGYNAISISSYDGSLIGNKYYISYSLKENINNFIASYKDDKLGVGIKDLFIIGQMNGYKLNSQEATLFIDSLTANISNLIVYGNLRNIKATDEAVRSGVLKSVNETSENDNDNQGIRIKNLNSNVSLNVMNMEYLGEGRPVQCDSVVGLFKKMPKSTEGNISFSGIIIGGNGDYGEDGRKGSHWSDSGKNANGTLSANGGDGTAAKLGGSGGKVNIFYIENDSNDFNATLVSTGLAKAGNPGADGHNGDGGRGADFFEVGTYNLQGKSYKFYNEDYGADKNLFKLNIVSYYQNFYHYGGSSQNKLNRDQIDGKTIGGVGNADIEQTEVNSETDNKISQPAQNGRGGLGGFIYYSTPHTEKGAVHGDWGQFNWVKDILNSKYFEWFVSSMVPDFCYNTAAGDQLYGFAAGSNSQDSARKIYYDSEDTGSQYCIWKAGANKNIWNSILYAG